MLVWRALITLASSYTKKEDPEDKTDSLAYLDGKMAELSDLRTHFTYLTNQLKLRMDLFFAWNKYIV